MNSGLLVILIVVIAVLAGALCAACLKVRNMRRSAVEQEERYRMLSDSLAGRDRYINQLINLCAAYVEGFEEYNRFVGRKLKVNQVHDLYDMIESGRTLKDQTDHFFEMFDDAVFKIYPDFIGDVNSLLKPECRLTPVADGRLSPELRLVAMMRFGVTDAGRLSKFLGLSVNTVYAYRNRMKNRAVDRDRFESDLIDFGYRV